MLFKRKAPNERVNGASIVLLGSFNPCIFQPQWFVSQNLLPKSESDKADVKVISPEVSQFDIAAEAIAEFSSADDPLGWQVVIPRRIEAQEIHKVRRWSQIIGWRFFPKALAGLSPARSSTSFTALSRRT